MPHRSIPSQSDSVPHKRTKRLRIDSDEDEDDEDNRPMGDSPGPVAPTKRLRLSSSRGSEDSYAHERGLDSDSDPNSNRNEGGDGDSYGDQAKRGSVSPSPTDLPLPSSTAGRVPGSRIRRASMSTKSMASQVPGSSPMPTTANTKQADEHFSSSAKKSRHKSQRLASQKKRTRQVESESEEDDYDDDEEDEEEDEISDDYDDCEENDRPSRSKSGRGRNGGGGGANKGQRTGGKDKDMAPIPKKAKFEGNSVATGVSADGQVSRRNSLHESTSGASMAGSKRPRTKRSIEENTLVDVTGDSVTPEPSTGIGSPSVVGEGKEESENAAPQAPKKRKLPTIKKVKTAGATITGPASATSTTKPPMLQPSSGTTTAAGGLNKLAGITDGKSARPKTNTASDLDLSNPSLYAELFKNPGGSASRTGINRRAKEEERRKELDKIREEYRAKLAQDAKVSFDLQGQAEKMARFEEKLRHRQSSALYPNFLAAKWREEWEREKRAHKWEWQQQHGDSGAKEEGEM